MAFAFSVIEWASVIDPEGLFRRSGQSEGDIGSGGVTGTSTVSFGATSTAQIRTGTSQGEDSYPDDSGARLDQAVTLNGVTYQPGANVEADFELILHDPVSGHYFRATWLAIDNRPVGVSVSRAWDATDGRYVAGDAGLYTPGRVLTLIDGDDLDQTPNIGSFTTNATYLVNGVGYRAHLDSKGAVVCFAAGTLIETDRGDMPVERLAVGDRVRTRDNGWQPLRWIGRHALAAEDLARSPHLRPIRIGAGALGCGLPRRALVVSPQHRLLVRSRIARRMFGAGEVLVAARHLVGLPGIDIDDRVDSIEYWHFSCDRHEIVTANGAPAEALYAGPEALRAMGPAARAELLALFPEFDGPARQPPAPARLLVPGGRGRGLARRHGRNRIPLLAE